MCWPGSQASNLFIYFHLHFITRHTLEAHVETESIEIEIILSIRPCLFVLFVFLFEFTVRFPLCPLTEKQNANKTERKKRWFSFSCPILISINIAPKKHHTNPNNSFSFPFVSVPLFLPSTQRFREN